MSTIVPSPYGPIDIDTGEVVPDVAGGVAIFEPAIRGTDAANNPIILLAMRDYYEGFLIVTDDGRLKWVEIQELQLDWRYNLTNEAWEDTKGGSLET